MFIAAPWFGTLYGEEKLTRFLRIAVVAGLIEALSLHIRGLLRRDMAFGALALINTASAAATAGVTILLAFVGFGFMSVAWATLAAAGTTTVLSFYLRPELAILRPTLRCWGRVLTFGGYNGASFVINQAYQTLPQLVLGHLLPHSAVGLYNRATTVSDMPDRIVLTSVFSVAFPALAVEVREGRSLKEAYLRALGYITVFYWPALILLALLAHPVISLLLGMQWLSVIPLLQVMAIAGLAWFPVILTSPVLLAVGANQDRVLADVLGRSLSAVVLCSSAYFGIMAMAAEQAGDTALPDDPVVLLRAAARSLQVAGGRRCPLAERDGDGRHRGRADRRRSNIRFRLRSVDASDGACASAGGDRLGRRRVHDAAPHPARTQESHRSDHGNGVRTTPACSHQRHLAPARERPR